MRESRSQAVALLLRGAVVVPAVVAAIALVVGGASTAGCSSSSSSTPGDGGAVDATHDGATNGCLTYGKAYGYACQSGATCSAGFVGTQDYSCGATGQICCAPVGEGGVDASDDVSVFVDGAVFEAGPTDAGAADAGGATDATDATTTPEAGVDAAVDGSGTSDATAEAASDAGAG
jgi:hypothetical protein